MTDAGKRARVRQIRDRRFAQCESGGMQPAAVAVIDLPVSFSGVDVYQQPVRRALVFAGAAEAINLTRKITAQAHARTLCDRILGEMGGFK